MAYFVLRIYFRKYFDKRPIINSPEPVTDRGLARLCRASLVLLVALVLSKIAVVFAGVDFDFRLTYIALASALPIIVLSPRRLSIIKGIDWHTMIFFAAMFVLMASVWGSGFFQTLLDSMGLNIASVSVAMLVPLALSQFISNVPLVALYAPTLVQLGASTKALMALAAGSTVAGNLTILGAVSNVIIIQNAERSAGETLTFFEFVKVGLPLTVVNVMVYWLYLTFCV